MGWRSGLNTREQCGFAVKAEEVIEVGYAGDGRWHNQAAVQLMGDRQRAGIERQRMAGAPRLRSRSARVLTPGWSGGPPKWAQAPSARAARLVNNNFGRNM